MTDIDSEDGVDGAEFYDLIRVPKWLRCWEFDLAALVEAYTGFYYTEGVYKALLEGLGELSQRKNKRLREREFVVWGGVHVDLYWAGVPAGIDADVVQLLGRRLRLVTGYTTQECAHTGTLAPFELFRYDHGRIIQYSDESVAGQERPDRYGAGVTVSYRMTWDLPPWLYG